MTPERYQQIDLLVDAALALKVEERAGFLDQACSGDEQLRQQVERLIEAHAHEESFLTSPALEAVAKERALTPAGPMIGDKLSHYQLLALLGIGGMGEVYKAEDLKLNRTVALKFLPPDTVSDTQARRRFMREARAASALNHPNIVTIHAIEEAEGLDFIVMEYVEGETLKAIIERTPMEFLQVIGLGLQIAEAAAAAHAAGIIHRDLKPANVLVTPQGKAKVLDFGLAKRLRPVAGELNKPDAASMSELTSAGVVVGTVAYMSPEQTRGDELDARSDVFSLGCILYEAATGKRPFDGPSALAIMHEIAAVDPPLPSAIKPGLPREFDSIIQRALAKDREQRYVSAKELADALGNLQAPAVERKRERRRLALLAACVALIVVGAGLWFTWRQLNLKWAREAVAEVEGLMLAGNYAEAYDLAMRARRYLPNDPALERLVPIISDDLSVSTEPAGAHVYLKRFASGEAGKIQQRQLIGTTPISNLKIARGDYIIYIEKDGYAPIQRTVSSALDRQTKALFGPLKLRREVKAVEGKSGESTFLFDADAPIRNQAKLIPSAQAPERMVFVPGGEYRLVSSGKPTEAAVRLDDYFIDQFEVSNREFIEFINAGGYLKKEFWKYPFNKDGKDLPWEEAMRLFRDRTGLPGPRGWSNQKYPDGKEDHPVTDITWYEAAAYAAFRGKQLPTVFQWEKAARDGTGNQIVGSSMPWGLVNPREPFSQRVNMVGSGTVPVASLEFGMSPYGCYQMAGNVAEWLINPQPEGYTITGGSWKDPPYIFGAFGAVPAWSSASTLGFRCVLNSPNVTGDQGAMPLNPAGAIPVYKPASEAQFQMLLRHYQYDQTPLDPQVVEVKETDVWRREKISFVADGGERTFAYLYLPKIATRPLQVIHYCPGAAVDFALTVPEEVEGHAGPYIKAGRAVFAVVLKGYIERPRPPGYTSTPGSVRQREAVVNKVIDSRRGLDYLVTRSEIDPRKIAFFGVSMSQVRLPLIGVETRYASIILMGCGYPNPGAIPEADGANFLAHVRPPKLWIHGRYDERVIFKTQGEPLYKLLSEPKRLIVHEGGHVPPLEVSVPMINGWLDETLGPVRRD
jgi:formylglycine-generating enzyme required for sulfatase activity/predicted Ser/Thr protein kinase